MSKSERAFHTLKHYMFECQCPACLEDWPLEDQIHDEIYRIPTFEQEVIYKVRFGDKKEAVKEIIEARRDVEKEMTYNRFRDALTSYQSLSEKLETHLRHPHAFFLQARSGITHCIWNLYCTQFPEKEISEELDVDANREHAKMIYKQDFAEKISTNEGLDLGTEDAVTETPLEKDNTKTALYDETRKMLEQSTKKFSDIKQEQERIEKEKQERITALQPSDSNLTEKTEENPPVEDSRQKLETLLKPSAEEQEIMDRQREYVMKCREEEKRIKDLKKKQWEEEDRQRREREEERKLRRAKETEEKIRQDKEREAKRREMRRLQEEERLKEKERRDKERERVESEFRLKQEEMRRKKKLQEEEELERLLLEADDLVIEEDPVAEEKDSESSTPILNNIEVPDKLENTKNREEKKEISQISNNIQFINFQERKPDYREKPKEKRVEEPTNVWSSLRQIKESSITQYEPIFSSNTESKDEKVSLNDIDDMIHNLAKQIAEKRLTDLEKPSNNAGDADKDKTKLETPVIAILEKDDEKGETTDCLTESERHSDPKLESPLINNACTETLKQPFDYEEWKTHMDKVFSNKKEEPLKKSPSDEKYLNSLKEKIKTNIEKNKKNFKDQEVKVPVKPKIQEPVKPKNSPDEFTQLKLKDKERKRRKQDAIFQQKLEESKSKVVDMSIKSQKLEKISEDSEREIQKIKDMAKKLVLRSANNESDFNEIFTNLDNLENVIRDTGKKSKKARKKEAVPEKSVHEVEVHWTEEDSNKWTTDKKAEVARVTSLLSALKTAAAHGASSFVSSSIQNTIKNCQQMQQEAEEERKREKMELLEKQTQLENAALNKKKDLVKSENKEKSKDKTDSGVLANNELQKSVKLDKTQINQGLKQESKSKELKRNEGTVKTQSEQIKIQEPPRAVQVIVGNGLNTETEMKTTSSLKKESPVKEQKSISGDEKSIEIKNNESSKKCDLPSPKKKTPVDAEVRKKEAKDEKVDNDVKILKTDKEITGPPRKESSGPEQKEKQEMNETVKKEDVAVLELLEENDETKCKSGNSSTGIKEINGNPKKEASSLGQKSGENSKSDKKSLNDSKVIKAKQDPISEVNKNENRRQEMDELEAEKAKLQRQEDFLAKMKSEENDKKKMIKEKLGKQLRQIQEDKKLHYENLEKKKRKVVETPKRNPLKEKETSECQKDKEKEIKAIKSDSKKLTHLINSVETLNKKDPAETNIGQKAERSMTLSTNTKEKKLNSITYADNEILNNDMTKISNNDVKENSREKSTMKAEIPPTPAEQGGKTEDGGAVSQTRNVEFKSKDEVRDKPPEPRGQLPGKIEERISSRPKEEPSSKRSWPKEVTTVGAKSFIPQKDQRNEIEFIKIGSPSQVRRAVLNNTNAEKDLVTTEEKSGYKISRVPTTNFEVKIPSKKKEKSSEELTNVSMCYVENVSKYSETKPSKKVSSSSGRPPPPSFKPPPPPTFRPPPPPPLF